MNRETLNKAYAEIYEFRDKLGEVLVDVTMGDNPGLEMAKSVIGTFYSCRTKEEFEIADEMLAAVCGWKFDKLVRMIKERDSDGFAWECVGEEEV